MKEVLRRLEGAPGVKGCLLMTRDGVLAAASLKGQESGDRMAALASAVIRCIDRRWGKKLGDGPVRITVAASRGRILFIPVDDFVLAIVADRDTDLEYTLMEVAGLAGRIQRIGRICV